MRTAAREIAAAPSPGPASGQGPLPPFRGLAGQRETRYHTNPNAAMTIHRPPVGSTGKRVEPPGPWRRRWLRKTPVRWYPATRPTDRQVASPPREDRSRGGRGCPSTTDHAVIDDPGFARISPSASPHPVVYCRWRSGRSPNRQFCCTTVVVFRARPRGWSAASTLSCEQTEEVRGQPEATVAAADGRNRGGAACSPEFRGTAERCRCGWNRGPLTPDDDPGRATA